MGLWNRWLGQPTKREAYKNRACTLTLTQASTVPVVTTYKTRCAHTHSYAQTHTHAHTLLALSLYCLSFVLIYV